MKPFGKYCMFVGFYDGCLAGTSATVRAADPLPSWNDTAAEEVHRRLRR